MIRTATASLAACACLGAASISWSADLDSESPDRNYRVIIDRNPFGLKPPPPPVTNAPVVTPPKDEILLTGITSIGGLRAYFMTKPPQGKTPEYYSLGPDESKNGLDVIDIDTKNKSVRVRNAGVETLMTFDNSGVKPPPTPSGPAVAATTATGAGVPGLPGAARAGIPAPAVSTTLSTTPSTTARASGRVRTIPSRNVRTPSVVSPILDANQPPPAEPNPDAAVQDVLIMELQKRVNPDVVFPPTPFPQ